MRYLMLALLLAASLGLYALDHDGDVQAASEAGYFSVTTTTTVEPGYPVGFISIEAVSGAVGVKVLGSRFTAGDDSLVVLNGDILNIDLYRAGSRTTAFILYPAGGATARGYYW